MSEVSQKASMTGIEWVKVRRVVTRSEKGGESPAKQGLLGRPWRDTAFTLSLQRITLVRCDLIFNFLIILIGR